MTTSCCIDLDMLAGYFGESLSDEERSRMMEHLAMCPECLEKFVNASSVMGSCKLEMMSDEMTQCALKRSGKTSKKLTQGFGSIFKRIKAWAARLFRFGFSARSDMIWFRNNVIRIDGLQTEIHIRRRMKNKADITIKDYGNDDGSNVSFILISGLGKIFAQNLKNGAACFDKIPYSSYQMISDDNGYEKGSCFFEVTKKGLYEKADMF